MSLLAGAAGSFRHGVHPAEHKESTAHLPVERMPFAGRFVLPLAQHLGAPARPVVQPGDRVARGQRIAEPGGFVSTAIHSPVTGQVVAIAPRPHPQGRLAEAIEIAVDPFDLQRPPRRPPLAWRELTDDAFAAAVQEGGLVGMGGAAFPTHVKYRLPEGRRVHTLVINGCECEPYLTCDHRLMVERPEAVLRGAAIAAARLGVETTVIGVEANKPDAVTALRAALDGRGDVRVAPLAVKYPQGAEKMLVRALFHQEVPSGKLPLDLGYVVNNVATMAALADWLERGQPLIERVVTVAGPGVRRPANLLVPLGTPVRAVLDHCGGLTADACEVVLGGPMMGTPIASLDVPVLKGTSGILAFTAAEAQQPSEYTCIRCGRCVEACPQLLNPSRLGRLARAGRYEEMEGYFVADCVECGSCSFACPSGIPIVQLIRVAKAALRERKA
ncbi:MAG TPA: electron transport complex subunit RsxC [Thermoanaerobaculia bacterium]|nr:electron transport complex subunit RsxC [Thermoanaerobaculia bacterium]